MGCTGSKVDDTSTDQHRSKQKQKTKIANVKTTVEKYTEEPPEKVIKQTYANYQSSHNALLQLENECALRGATFLQSGDLIVTDYKNNKLKLFNAKYEFVNALEMPNAPWDVCPSFDNPGDIFTTVPFTQEVHRVSMIKLDSERKPKLVSVEHFRTDGFCWGITCFDDGLAVSVKVTHKTQTWPKPPDFEIHIHDFDGTFRRSIVYDASEVAFFMEPKYLNVTYDNLFLLVSDYKQHAVFCINNQDELIYKYEGMKSPNGLAMDEHKNVHITSFFGAQRVHKVGANGKYIDGLPLTNERPLFPHCVCYRQKDRTIVLSTENSLEVYKLV